MYHETKVECQEKIVHDGASELHHARNESPGIQRSWLSHNLLFNSKLQDKKCFTQLRNQCKRGSLFGLQIIRIGELKPTKVTIQLADMSVKISRGIIEDVLVQIDKLYFPVDFIIIDMQPVSNPANEIPVILGRPFLATSNAI